MNIYTGVDGDFAPSAPEDVLIDAVTALGAELRCYARWHMSSATLARVLKMKDADGNHIFWRDLRAAPPRSLLGLDIEVDHDMPDIETGAAALAIRAGNDDAVKIVFALSGPD